MCLRGGELAGLIAVKWSCAALLLSPHHCAARGCSAGDTLMCGVRGIRLFNELVECVEVSSGNADAFSCVLDYKSKYCLAHHRFIAPYL